jgi:hypothetical protein
LCTGDDQTSRLTFYDAGAIVLSSGSSPALQVGSTVYVSVTSMGVQQPWSTCEPKGQAAFDSDKPAAMQTQAYLDQQDQEDDGLDGSSIAQFPGVASQKKYRLAVTPIPKKASSQFAMSVGFARLLRPCFAPNHFFTNLCLRLLLLLYVSGSLCPSMFLALCQCDLLPVRVPVPHVVDDGLVLLPVPLLRRPGAAGPDVAHKPAALLQTDRSGAR